MQISEKEEEERVSDDGVGNVEGWKDTYSGNGCLVQEHTLTKDEAKKRSDEVATSTNEESVQNLNTTKGNRISDLQKHPKGRNSRASKPPFQWKNKILNASEREVPSGPNPISNR
ncbi:hypothetical protein MTR_2g437780 [Medicago truncatula]|uniref:Uncharacterized protein n=1 Tax=Medicago truncatula TaxID=3880 RepID=A0A072V7N1_MEDTR|nr:hypothetical protein MTR_2g437780 [Medicago truncatula]